MKIINQGVVSINAVKLYHVGERRNEWVNWNGETNVVERGGLCIKPSLRSARSYAERWRKQGTNFVIEELAGVCAMGEYQLVLASEIFVSSPMSWVDDIERIPQYATLSEFRDLCVRGDWRDVVKVYDISEIDDGVEARPDDGVYRRWISRPGKGKSGLAWCCQSEEGSTPYRIDDGFALKLAHLCRKSWCLE